jgi:hypothetical protein
VCHALVYSFVGLLHFVGIAEDGDTENGNRSGNTEDQPKRLFSLGRMVDAEPDAPQIESSGRH